MRSDLLYRAEFRYHARVQMGLKANIMETVQSQNPSDQQQPGASSSISSSEQVATGQSMSNGSAPPGIPEGLPQEMWLEYLRIQFHERIQLKQSWCKHKNKCK